MLHGNSYSTSLNEKLILSISSVAIVVSTYLYYGIYWEENMSLLAAVFSGCITSLPVDAWLIELCFFIGPAVASINSLFPHVHVMGVFFFLSEILWVYLLLLIFYRLLENKITASWVKVAVPVFFVIAVTTTSLIYAYPTRVSMLLGIGSILMAHQNSKWTFTTVLLFIVACLTRFATTIFLLLLVTPLLFFEKKEERKKNLIFFSLPWIVVSIIMMSFTTGKFLSSNIGLKIDQTYEFPLSEGSISANDSLLKTEKDSVRFLALTQYFILGDTAQMTLDYIARVVDINSYYEKRFSDMSSRFSERVIPVIEEHKYEFLFSYLLILLLCFSNTAAQVKNLIPVHLAFWGILIVISLTLRMPCRFFDPWLSSLVIVNIYFLLVNATKIRFKYSLLIVLVLLLICSVAVADYWANREKVTDPIAAKNIKTIEPLMRDYDVVLWNRTGGFYLTKILALREMEPLRETVFLGLPFVEHYRYGQERCIKKFGFSPLNWKEMGRILNERKSTTRFVTDEEYAQFLGVYFEKIYGIKFKLVKDDSFPEIIPESFVYYLE